MSLTLEIPLGCVMQVGIGTAGRQDGPSRKTGRRGMRSALSHLAEESESLEGTAGPLFRLSVPSRSIGKAFTGPVHGRPKTVIVAVTLSPFTLVTRPVQTHRIDVTEGCAEVVFLDLFFKELSFHRVIGRPSSNPTPAAVASQVFPSGATAIPWTRLSGSQRGLMRYRQSRPSK